MKCDKLLFLSRPFPKMHRRHTNMICWIHAQQAAIMTRHYGSGLHVLQAAEGTKSPIDLQSRHKTRQWFLLATGIGSTGQNPTSVLWELGDKERDRHRVGGSINWVDPSSMQALQTQHTASQSTERHDGTYMTGHIHASTERLHNWCYSSVSALRRASICSFTSSANSHATAQWDLLSWQTCCQWTDVNIGRWRWTPSEGRLQHPGLTNQIKSSFCNPDSIENPFFPKACL